MKYIYIVITISLSLIIGCKDTSQIVSQSDKPTVLVSILPQKYFVERIAGDTVNVNVLLPPGAFPATFEPTPRTFSEISNSQLYFMVGHPKFALEVNWSKKIIESNKEMKVVNLSESVNGMFNDSDPHIWLSPKIVKKELKALSDSLASLIPENADLYQKNLDIFISDVDSLVEDLNKKFQNLKNNKFLVLHPAWGYFAQDFGLEQVSIEEHGHESGHHNIKEIIEFAKTNEIKTVFVQKHFSSKEADTIAREISGNVVKIDPLAENWIENLRLVSDTLAKNLK